MAARTRYCPSCLSGLRTSFASMSIAPLRPSPFAQQARAATNSAYAQKQRRKEADKAAKKKKKARTTYYQPNLKKITQFNLVDAMRYLRAAEVGRPPTSAKYELAIRLRTLKNGAVIRNRMRLPHPIRTDMRIAAICAPDSAQAKAAKAAGASLVGEDEIFEAVKAGRIDFDRCICHVDSLPRLAQAGVGRVLGPRGLMPSAKLGTVVKDVGSMVRDMVGSTEYRERLGVIRMGVGQLGFTPEELQRNIRAFMENLRKDMNNLSDRISKEIHEVVLSSTHGPGFSLNGEFSGPNSIPTNDLGTM